MSVERDFTEPMTTQSALQAWAEQEGQMLDPEFAGDLYERNPWPFEHDGDRHEPADECEEED